MNKLTSYLSLFGSLSTLICCALPSMFVALGAGAVLSGILTNFPELIWVSENKGLVFGLAGAMLAISGFLLWRAKNLPCPLDPKLALACKKTRRSSLIVYFVSVCLFGVGFLFAFILPAI